MFEQSAFANTLTALQDSLSVITRRFYDQLVQRLREADVLENALNVGDKFPNFALPNRRGYFVQLSDLLACGPVGVTVYCGSGGSVCRGAFGGVGGQTPVITAMRATVIGI